MSDRRHVSSGSPYEAEVGFSRAIRVGSRTVVAGTAPMLADGTSVPGGAADQARRCFEIIREALAKLDVPLEHVIRTRTYLTRVDIADEVGRVHGEIFGQIRPVSTMVVVSALLRPEWLVEIEVEADSPST